MEGRQMHDHSITEDCHEKCPRWEYVNERHAVEEDDISPAEKMGYEAVLAMMSASLSGALTFVICEYEGREMPMLGWYTDGEQMTKFVPFALVADDQLISAIGATGEVGEVVPNDNTDR